MHLARPMIYYQRSSHIQALVTSGQAQKAESYDRVSRWLTRVLCRTFSGPWVNSQASCSSAVFLVTMEVASPIHEGPKSDLKAPPIDQTAQLDIDNGVTSSYIDPAEERKVLWKFDVRSMLQYRPQCSLLMFRHAALRDWPVWPLLHDGQS